MINWQSLYRLMVIMVLICSRGSTDLFTMIRIYHIYSNKLIIIALHAQKSLQSLIIIMIQFVSNLNPLQVRTPNHFFRTSRFLLKKFQDNFTIIFSNKIIFTSHVLAQQFVDTLDIYSQKNPLFQSLIMLFLKCILITPTLKLKLVTFSSLKTV